MKHTKLLATLVVVPALVLAGCSGIQASANANQASKVSIVNAVAQVPVAAKAATSNTSASTASSLAAALPTGTASDLQNVLESIYQKVSPSVVSIDVIIGNSSSSSTASSNGQNNPFGNSPFGFGNGNSGNSGQTTSEALGSGFVWDTQGHIVTNNHVINGATHITVTFSDGTSVTAKVVGADPNADLAVLKVNVPASKLVPVTLGNTANVKVGELAIAIGEPFGLQETMTQGIISGLSRTLPVGLDSQTTQSSGPTYNIPDIIQTDAPINPGNSGGVLVDTQGHLIGVTAAIESNSNSSAGIGFVIPTEIVQKVIPSLIKTGTYKHPYLGISGTDMTPAIAKAMGLPSTTRGALVGTISSGGPAANAGLQGSTQQVTINGQQTTVGGDVITAINGQPVNSFDDIGSYLFLNTTPGQTVTLTLLRQGKTVTAKVTLGTMPVQ